MKVAFAKALKNTRKSRGLTQEDFSDVSSRTYLSMLERGKKSPTLDKLQTIAQTIGIHCLSLMTLTYMYNEKEKDLDTLLLLIKNEVESVENKKRDDQDDSS
jgi:transcriptional regulator with XRE-family HTH domain